MRTDRYRNNNDAGSRRFAAGSEKHGRSADRPGKPGNSAVEPKKRSTALLKVLLVVILLLLIAIAGSVYWVYRSAEQSIALVFTEESPEVEFGSRYSAMDFVRSSEGDVAADTEQADTGSIGRHTMKYTVTKPVLGGLLKPSREFVLNYTVVDTTPPLVLWSGNGTVIETGASFSIGNVISYGDNADPEPEVNVDGKVDTDTPGEYPLHVTVTDASGNAVSWDLTVEVADELPSYEDTQKRTKFKKFISENKGSGRSFGIDVSAWQDDVDFSKVKEAGCEFVMIRIGYSSEGQMTTDKRFEQNIRRAKEAGLKVGVYLYTCDNTDEKIRSVAGQLVSRLGGETLDLPVAFDWEDFGLFPEYKMSFADLNRLYDIFAGVLSENGYDCMLYGSKNYIEKVWTDTDIRPVWLAHYTDRTDYKGPYMMWQASCTGRIPGISGDVDMDILYE